MAGDVSATPAVVNGVVYVPDWGGYISAIRASDGHVIWRRLISSYNGVAGSVSRTDPVVNGSTLVIGTQTGADVIAINAATGAGSGSPRPTPIRRRSSPAPRSSTRTSSTRASPQARRPRPRTRTTRAAPSAAASWRSARSPARLLWKTYTVPANGGKPGGYSGAAVWGSTPAVDPATDSVYVGTGNNYLVPAAAAACVANALKKRTSDANCTAADDYFDSVLSLNLRTGKVNWGHRLEGYDAWTLACLSLPPGVSGCPSPEGPNCDFSGGAEPVHHRQPRRPAGRRRCSASARRAASTGCSTRPPAASSGTPSSARPTSYPTRARWHGHRRHPDLRGRG